jgi:hypothetical protein
VIKSFRQMVDSPNPPKLTQPPKPPKLGPIVTALSALMTDYAAARRRDPLGLLKLFNPMKLRSRLKLLNDAFKPAWASNKSRSTVEPARLDSLHERAVSADIAPPALSPRVDFHFSGQAGEGCRG